jgi:tetraprenyl-beta-curcumene synthase
MAAADAPLRDQALAALADKRPQSEGAALFTILPPQRSQPLLRMLVAYQIMWDYLDSIHEQQPDLANGMQLHHALTDAYYTDQPVSDCYRQHAHKDDSGYLAALIFQCRHDATRLASYALIRVMLLQEAGSSAQALSINHDPNRECRIEKMRIWSARYWPNERRADWFELTAAAAAALTMFALLAEATNHASRSCRLNAIRSIYSPWACSAATMLDSYADRAQDNASQHHIYIDYYASAQHAITRIGELVRESLMRTRHVHGGHKHSVILASMVAMYLTRDSSRTPGRQWSTNQLARSGGTLTHILIPALRAWRTIYHLRSS